jgi:hypothetical protein
MSISTKLRIFKRLDYKYYAQQYKDLIAWEHFSKGTKQCHKFTPPVFYFMHCFARNQWNNKTSFISAPHTYTGSGQYPYWAFANDINDVLRYYMKPHTLTVFGRDETNKESNSDMLVRGWLNGTEEENRVILTMERVCPRDDYSYIQNIIENKWKPAAEHWESLEKAPEIVLSCSFQSELRPF